MPVVIWVLIWLNAPGGPRDLRESGFSYQTLAECLDATKHSPAPGEFGCQAEVNDDKR